MLQLVREARDAKDSLGGMITCMIHNVPTGIGEPVFDKVLYIYICSTTYLCHLIE